MIKLFTIKSAPTYLQAGRPKNTVERFQKRLFKSISTTIFKSKGENSKGKTSKVKKINQNRMKCITTTNLANNQNARFKKIGKSEINHH